MREHLNPGNPVQGPGCRRSSLLGLQLVIVLSGLSVSTLAPSLQQRAVRGPPWGNRTSLSAPSPPCTSAGPAWTWSLSTAHPSEAAPPHTHTLLQGRRQIAPAQDALAPGCEPTLGAREQGALLPTRWRDVHRNRFDPRDRPSHPKGD